MSFDNTSELKFGQYFDHKALIDCLNFLENKYDFINVGILGNSILGKSIPIVTLGKGKKSVLYIGSHHGMEWITSAILISFLNDFCYEFVRGKHMQDISSRVIFETRKLIIVPMLNPDGIDYQIHGLQDNNLIKDRVTKMNSGSSDFSKWQANARGVDLNHNYASGFEEYKILERKLGIYGGCPTKYSGEYSESEPETKALCNYVRIQCPDLAISLHTQGEEIYYTNRDCGAYSSLPIVQTFSRLTGYKISLPTGTARYGGFTDWFIEEFNRPSFTFECGLGVNPLPFSELNTVYNKLKRALFTAPILI